MTTPTHITTSGGLISAAFIENVREPGSRQRGVKPVSFALPWADAPKSPAVLEETIATAWELLLERWDAVRNDLPMMDVSQVRARWLLPLFQLLDFDPVYLRGDTILDEAGKLRYSLSHRGWGREGAPILHTIIPSQDLDARTATGRRIKAKSPHDMLQAFLNASTADLWAVLTNGILLRILRDYHHTFSKGYVQFDLESILETRNYGDFRALYRICHASRFIQTSKVSKTLEVLMPLEQFYKDSIATGIKVGEDLRGQVRQAIETLGNGFLDGDLIRRLQGAGPELAEGDDALCRRYYSEILHVIYRVLFLLFAEQRGMMPGRDSLYAESYSIARLRTRAEGDIPREDDFADLWHGLRVTFRMVREGVPELDIFGYNGMLFAQDQTPLLDRFPPPSQGGGLGRGVCNSDLLRAIRALTLIEREGVLQRISYADLGVEELGSIYESLLDFTPRVTTGPDEVNGRQVPANTFFLDPRGSERKTTGSFYTHPSLVNELIKSALLPVMRERLTAAGLCVIEEGDIGEATSGLLTDYAGLTGEQRAAGEAAILSVKVLDPAVGSGHFLVKANNVMGAELARIRTGDEYPTEAQVQAAKRDVLAHCIYGVDLNPMAVELCKVSLWINASVADKPLSFLDHHIKCGNSLIGATPELMDAGIPTDAFKPVTGDDKAVAKAVRARNRRELKEWEAGAVQGRFFQVTLYEPGGAVHQEYVTIAGLAEEQPKMARERYAEYLTADDYRRKKLEADFWTAAFFWPLTTVGAQVSAPTWTPTHGEFIRLREQGPETLPPEALEQIEALAERYRFFHWHLEFPDVFADDGAGGFDVVLGNPPWERIKLQEKEFFADKAPEIANARTPTERRRLILKLPQTNPVLHVAYVATLRESEAIGHFLRDSCRFLLTAGGDINTYAVFAGLGRQIIASNGRAGIIVPTGIATDYTYRGFFTDLVDRGRLTSLYDFENRRKLFPQVDSRMKFCLLTLVGGGATEADFAFFLHTTDELTDLERRFPLNRKDLALMNPNTRTVPVFRTRQDAELTRKLYRATPVLVNEQDEGNPWNVKLTTMFHSSSAAHLFHLAQEVAVDSRWSEKIPLYEARLLHQFDHRFATYDQSGQEHRETLAVEHRDPNLKISTRLWIDRSHIEEFSQSIASEREWLVAFRKIARSTDERTAIFAVLPFIGALDSVHLVIPRLVAAQSAAVLLANTNSFCLDFVLRQTLGGANFNFYILKQLPVLSPDRYALDSLDFIVPRVIELTYTAWDLQAFAQDILDEVGPETWARWFKDAPIHTSPPPEWATTSTPAPFIWDEERRAVLRAELDGLYAHLYGLTREELDYILDTFPIVRRKDEAKYGEYRTKRMVLEAFDQLESFKQ
ncbi:MAG: N-6 DNA methylase [Chloroflexi bacterium]|nr:N-6 DNA methylase [Chloroflexota bacterium]